MILIIYFLGAYLTLATLYYSLCCIASLFYRAPLSGNHTVSDPKTRFVLLVPAYKEDCVIINTVQNVLQQQYDKQLFDIVVIADQLQASTLTKLRKLPTQVIEVKFEKSTKAKAINFAIQQLKAQYDMVVVLDADNHIAPDFLQKINCAFQQGHLVVQAHRTAKNQEGNMAQLDAISEELNNAIFRKGQQVLGLPTSLIGSGMAMAYQLHHTHMREINAIGGFDKELELSILKDSTLPQKKIVYLNDALVYDEKVANIQVFKKQRTRWFSSQVKYGWRGLGNVFQELFLKANIAYANKVLQLWLPPRLFLVGLLGLMTIIGLFIHFPSFIYFSALSLLLSICFLVALPKKLRSYKTFYALVKLPIVFITMLKAVFHLRQGYKSFLPTPHQYSSKS